MSPIEGAEIERIRSENNQSTLAKIAILPAMMFVCYVSLLLHFKSRGGYRQVQIRNPQPALL